VSKEYCVEYFDIRDGRVPILLWLKVLVYYIKFRPLFNTSKHRLDHNSKVFSLLVSINKPWLLFVACYPITPRPFLSFTLLRKTLVTSHVFSLLIHSLMPSRVAPSKPKSSYFRSKLWSLFCTPIIKLIRSGDKLDSRIRHIETCLLATFVKDEFWEFSEILKHNSLVIRVINNWLTWPRQKGTVGIENLKANRPLNGLTRRVCSVYNCVLYKACNMQASDLPFDIKVSFWPLRSILIDRKQRATLWWHFVVVM
jgi:hypothetical protein